jgi:ATP-dependent exoDNAse (exonuclease V) alpha subunit
MAKVQEAVSRDARMILLGDKDQLASVEPGPCWGYLRYRNNAMFFRSFDEALQSRHCNSKQQ